MPLPEDKIEAALSSQQSTYEHIQSMSATFLSITAAAIAAIAGLTSAGIIEPQILDIPDAPNISGRIVLFSDNFYVPEQVVGDILDITLFYSSLYLFSASILISISILILFTCLNTKPLYPEKYVRTSLEEPLKVKQTKNNEIEKEWIEKNVAELEYLVSSFKRAKKRAIYGIILSFFSVYGFIGVTFDEPNSFIVLIWFLIPLFIITYFSTILIRVLLFVYEALKSIWHKRLELIFGEKSSLEIVKYWFGESISKIYLHLKNIWSKSFIKSSDFLLIGLFLVPGFYYNALTAWLVITNMVVTLDLPFSL